MDHRTALVISQMAWSCQRSVRWADWLCIRSYHDGYHGFPPVMLFNIKADPHLQDDLAPTQQAVADHGLALLDQWMSEKKATATHPVDPMETVMQEGGPLHTRGVLPAYLARLKATGRADGAEKLSRAHPAAAVGKP